MSTGFTLQYQDNNNVTRTVNVEAFGNIEGTSDAVTGLFKLDFQSQGPNTLTIRMPTVSPDTASQIPYKSQVVLFYKNNPVFVGRRYKRTGRADARNPYTEYTFQDIWFDFHFITYKQVWFAGAYQPCTVNGNTITFVSAQLGLSSMAQQMFLYNSAGTRVAEVNISWVDSTHATITSVVSGSTTLTASATCLYSYPDQVLFQYLPGDAYQTANQVQQFYISTGEQLRELLDFAIATGVNIQYPMLDANVSEMEAALHLFVPWYPVRAARIDQAIKICMRWHPDCFIEIDYTTLKNGVPCPTFHVRRRGTGTATIAGTQYTQPSLTPVTLPYKSTANNRLHISSDVEPLPELVPARIAINYRYIVNGQVLAFPNDIYPTNAPDQLGSFDYSLDLQGPKYASQIARLTSTTFDASNSPAGMAWWAKKCPDLRDNSQDQASRIVPGSVQMCDKNGNVGTASLTIVDSNGNPVNYGYELTGGSVNLWMNGISVVEATVSTYFKWQKWKTNSSYVVGETVTAQRKHVRVRLVNSPSVIEQFTQALTTGEAIPTGLAQYLYTALQPLQYKFTHTIKEEPFSGVFIKPGLNSMNLSGGDPSWTSMNATVQNSSYTIMADANGNVLVQASIRCGPVEYLEPGQYVQLYNLFANRNLNRIDPWERITGVGGASGSLDMTPDNVPKENSTTGTPDRSFDTVAGTISGS